MNKKVFRQLPGDTRLVYEASRTEIPPVEENLPTKRQECFRWTKEDIDTINKLVKESGGTLTFEQAVSLYSPVAKREVVPFDPLAPRPFAGKVMPPGYRSKDTMAKQQGEGVDGVMYPPRTRKQMRHRMFPKKGLGFKPRIVDANADLGLGFNAWGNPIQPRMDPMCKELHLVEGDNVYITRDGHQQCKKCRDNSRRRYNSKP